MNVELIDYTGRGHPDPEAEAIAVRKVAERRLGFMMAEQKVTVGMANAGGDQKSKNRRVSKKPDDPPTLAEAGIDKNLANRARNMAAITIIPLVVLLPATNQTFTGVFGVLK
jgi:hypothetical protein